jgi:hypothetical protein
MRREIKNLTFRMLEFGIGALLRKAAIGVTIVLACSSHALAHEKRAAGQFALTIGWADEPAFTGFKNFVTVAVADSAGAPIIDPAASLAVEIAFGDRRLVLPLRPAFQHPGEFRAALVPTRAGTYSFRITGTMKGQSIDTLSTCSDKTFDCVRDASEVQFPAKDPSTGQLSERVGRALPRAERAIDAAAGARITAAVAIALAVLALLASLGLVWRARQKHS